MPAFYSNPLNEFLKQSEAEVRDELTQNSKFFHQLKTQSESWRSLIRILKESCNESFFLNKCCSLLIEYSIPRRSKRIDSVILLDDLIFVIEFKDGKTEYLNADRCQLEDYCLDLRDFHFESNEKTIIPILLSANASQVENEIYDNADYVKPVILANKHNLGQLIKQSYVYWHQGKDPVILHAWNLSKYFPTPTIIEAAQTLFAGRDVKQISRSHAGAENLENTSNAVLEAIEVAKKSNSKIICFITGVPGAGKTLAGLQIAHNKTFKRSEDGLGVFLSGNSPLVKVLSEALARDFSKRNEIPKIEARRRVTTFIKNVHQFIDDYYEDSSKLPVDKVLIYDEAQRAWTKEYKFRKSEGKVNASEPDILLSIMDRFDSYSVIIALIGGGQEINTGEGGLAEWGKSLKEKFAHWKVYISPELKTGDHSTGNQSLFTDTPKDIAIIENEHLHLKTCIRSYKADRLSHWVSLVLANNPQEAKELYLKSLNDFPLLITRSLQDAKLFLKNKSRGSRRSGLVASSGGRRLRAVGLDINAGLKGTSTQEELGSWYLNSPSDVRSSNFLEIVASEFAVQGLELDWVGLCWDADLRRNESNWDFKSFKGTSWSKVSNEQNQTFVLNKYRVLLTRAREGMVIYIPLGAEDDETRHPQFYDETYNYLVSCGLRELVYTNY